MSDTFFLDTSVLIKLYHQEPGTERVEEIFRQTESSLIISELAIVEMYSSLARKVRIGEITLQAQEEAFKNFEEDLPRDLSLTHRGSSGAQSRISLEG